ncbi:MAG: NAD-dependent epimerase/dehydratase family protein [Planctomycetota bacterium]
MPDGSLFLVTGGAGFIGSNLVAELLRRDASASIIVIDDFRSGSFANLVEACDRKGVGPFRGEVIPVAMDAAGLAENAEVLKPDAVFHLGAITDTTVTDEAEMIDANTSGFSELVQACSDFEVPLVYASSAATYGSPPHADHREPFPVNAAGKPNNVYGFSKWLMEEIHRRAHEDRQTQGLPPAHVVGLRYFNVFGPGETRKGKMASMAHQLTHQVLAGKPPRVFEDGSQARDQVHVDDIVGCTLAAAGLGDRPRDEIAPGIYNAGSGRATTFNEIIAAIREALGISETDLPTDYFEMPASVRAFYQDWTCADMSETQRGLGFTPSRDPIAATTEYAAWLAGQHRGEPVIA